jgi:MFS family permease
MSWYTPAPGAERIGDQATRRRAVLALYLGYPAFIAGSWFSSFFNQRHLHMQAIPFLALILAAMVGICWGGYVLLSRTGINLPNLPDHTLDERQRGVRDAAYRTSFLIISILLLGVALYLMLANGFGWSMLRSGEDAQAIFWGVLLVITTLPTAVIAWTTPDPDEEDGLL